MCGLCGLIYHDPQRPVDPALLQRMTDAIHHRGPDDEGHDIDGSAGFGSRRLSIVGLSDGRMPMRSEDGSLAVVYNGELYNHPQLKTQLQAKGYVYRTHADTETFLHLYREYGDAFLRHAEGMFALALWDQKPRRLILARDRLGIKPLYYHYDRQALRFASEIKSLLCDPDVPREIDLNALNFLLAYLSAPAPYSMFRGIRQVNPGEMLIYQNGEMIRQRYWQPQEAIRHLSSKQLEQTPAALRRRLDQAVQQHLMADVPLGAFLSGGIDSSILAALMRQHLGEGFQTFSIGFTGNRLFDESSQAQAFASHLGCQHHQRRLRPADLLDALQHITWQLDEPLADSSCLPVYYVSQLAAEHVKVVLSGDGGDEVFAGYRKYQAEYYRRYVQWLPPAAQRFLSRTLEPRLPESRASRLMDHLRQVKKFFRGLDPDPFERHLGWTVHFEDSLRHSLLLPEVRRAMDFDEARHYRRRFFDEFTSLSGSNKVDELNRMLWVDLRHNLPADMLAKVDRMSMLHSLEVRVPFLDHHLVEFAFSLPASLKLKGKTTKWILKEAFKDLLPAKILHRPKHGFDVPVGEWFKHELRDLIEEVCSPDTTKRRGLFDPQRVQQLLNDHQAGKRDYNNHLWIMLSLELWQRQYLDSPRHSLTRPSVSESL